MSNTASPTAAPSVRELPELRSILESLRQSLEQPVGTIRQAMNQSLDCEDDSSELIPHIQTIEQMSGDVIVLTQRFLAFIDEVDRLPEPKIEHVRPEELLAEVDHRVMPEAIGRGVGWSCGADGPIGPLAVDRALCVEALVSWGLLALEAMPVGEEISLVALEDRGTCLVLSSTAPELIPDLKALLGDPLFKPELCLEPVGRDWGSRIGLAWERTSRLDGRLEADLEGSGPVRELRIRFPLPDTH